MGPLRAFIAATILIAVLPGCVAPNRYPNVTHATDADAQLAAGPLVCDGPEQCTLWWRRAQIWIARTSAYKLQVISDTVLETYGARPGSTGWAFSATREPLKDGAEQIELSPHCGSYPQCTESPVTLRADFARYVMSL